jgi:Flp pilus assembly protein TadD
MMEEYSRKQIILARIRRACDLIDRGRYNESLQFLEGIKDAGDRQWMIHFHLAQAYIGRSEFNRAEKELHAALDLAPVGPDHVQIREMMEYLEEIR